MHIQNTFWLLHYMEIQNPISAWMLAHQQIHSGKLYRIYKLPRAVNFVPNFWHPFYSYFYRIEGANVIKTKQPVPTERHWLPIVKFNFQLPNYTASNWTLFSQRYASGGQKLTALPNPTQRQWFPRYQSRSAAVCHPHFQLIHQR